MPPNVKMQQDDALREIRCCALGTVALTLGVFWGILGGVLAALLVYFINKGLLKYNKWFYTKTIVLATLTNEILCNMLLRYSNGVFEILMGPILKRGNGIGLKCKFGMVAACVVLFAFHITNRKPIEEDNVPSP